MLAVLDTRHIYDVRAVALAPIRTHAPLGTRTTSVVRDGTVTGDRLNGRLIQAGSDWVLGENERVGHIDARHIIETPDGAAIHVHYNGRLVFHGDALKRLRAGEPIAETDTYFRIAPTFEAPGDYDWLNAIQAIGVGRVEPGADGSIIVRYRVYEVL
jgi:Protein of unknown function (DUF3237)